MLAITILLGFRRLDYLNGDQVAIEKMKEK
jgi:hypothetical protein